MVVGAFSTYDVKLIVEAAFGYAPYATPTWTDISKHVHQASIRRGGAATVTPRAVAGRCTLTLNNDDDRFDPNNTGSPYTPDVKVSVPIRIRATYATVTYPLFYGFVTSWDIEYPAKGHRSIATVPCVDGLQLLNQHDISDETYPIQDTDARIVAVLDAVGWPAGWRALDSAVASVEAFTPTQSVSAYTHLVQVADAEVGSVFIAADGDFSFHNRIHHSGGATSEGTFGPSDLAMDEVTPAYDDEFLYNDVRVKRATGVEQIASDAASITAHRNRTLSHVGIMETDAGAMNVAEWEVALFKDINPRIDNIKVKPQADPANVWPVVLNVDLGDSITVKTAPHGGGDGLDQQLTVNQIWHDIRPDRWETAYGCYPLAAFEIADYWILGTSTLGTETRLA